MKNQINFIIIVGFALFLLVISCKSEVKDKQPLSNILPINAKSSKKKLDIEFHLKTENNDMIKYLSNRTYFCECFSNSSSLDSVSLYVVKQLDYDSVRMINGKALKINNFIFPIINEKKYFKSKKYTMTGGRAKIILNDKNEVISFVKYQ